MKMLNTYKNILIVIIFSLSFQVLASVKIQVDLSPAGSFEITSPRVRGNIQRDGSGLKADQLRVAVRSLVTANDLRDSHLHEKLEAQKHPQIIVTEAKGSGGHGSAQIEIAGIKKPLPFTYTESAGNAVVSFQLDLKDFNITGINYMGVGVRDIIKGQVSIPIR
jgi:hypothetical protein